MPFFCFLLLVFLHTLAVQIRALLLPLPVNSSLPTVVKTTNQSLLLDGIEIEWQIAKAEHMLVLRHIEKEGETTRGGKYILKDLNFYTKGNEYVEIVTDDLLAGSSLVNILSMMDTNFTGEYIFNGVAVNKLSFRELKKFRLANVGLVLGHLMLIGELTVEENLNLPYLYNNKNGSAARVAVPEVMQKFNLLHRRNYYPANLPLIVMLKTAIAQALMLKPAALVLKYDVSLFSLEEHLELTNLLFALSEEGLTVIVVINEKPPASLAHRHLTLADHKLSLA